MIALMQEALRDIRALGVDDVEISVERRDLGASRFANSYLTQSGRVVDFQARVRVALGAKIGAASTSGVSREELMAAAKLARDAAVHAPVSPFDGFARGDASDTSAVDDATAAYSPDDRAEVLARVFARAARDRLRCAGIFQTSKRELAVVTAGGVARRHTSTDAHLALICLDGVAGHDASGYAAWHGPAIGALDANGVAEEAVDRAVRSRDPVDLPPGPIDVVLSPHAIAEVLEWMAIGSFSARAVLDGSSFLAGRRGEPLCDPRVTIFDDAAFAHPQAVPYPFDAEGVLKRRVVLVDGGRGGEPLTDGATAARMKTRSSGHAPPAGNTIAEGPVPANLVMMPGGDDDLAGKLERGLVITRFHYVNGYLDTRRATMTGMTRDGAFLVENGKLGRAIKNLRWTESLLDAFSPARLIGIGRELSSVPSHWTSHGAYLCPWVAVRGWHFTGKSR